MKGKLYIGPMSGNFFTGVTIDSLELRDDEDSLFVATGRVKLEYDMRDIVDRRLHFRRRRGGASGGGAAAARELDVELQADVRIRRSRRRPRGPERGFGDFIVIDSAHVRNASFRLTIPWHPDDSLHGARRDSALRVNLARKDHEIRRTREGSPRTTAGPTPTRPFRTRASPIRTAPAGCFVIDTAARRWRRCRRSAGATSRAW